jgi:Ca2+-transporting ATPase
MAFNLRSLRYSLLQAPPHGWLVAAVAGSLAVTAAMVSWPQAREAFGVGIPSLVSMEIALAVAIAVTVLSDLVKVVLRRRKETLA